MDWTALSPNSYVAGVLTPSMTTFGNRIFKEVIKAKCSHKDGVLIQQDWGLVALLQEEERERLLTLCAGTKKRHHPQARKRTWSWPPASRTMRNQFLSLKPSLNRLIPECFFSIFPDSEVSSILWFMALLLQPPSQQCHFSEYSWEGFPAFHDSHDSTGPTWIIQETLPHVRVLNPNHIWKMSSAFEGNTHRLQGQQCLWGAIILPTAGPREVCLETRHRFWKNI